MVDPPLVREKQFSKNAIGKVSFVEENKSVIDMIEINIIVTIYEFYEMNWKVA